MCHFKDDLFRQPLHWCKVTIIVKALLTAQLCVTAAVFELISVLTYV